LSVPKGDASIHPTIDAAPVDYGARKSLPRFVPSTMSERVQARDWCALHGLTRIRRFTSQQTRLAGYAPLRAEPAFTAIDGANVHIRGPRALEQFAQTPPNATVFLVLGTNDANGTIARLDKSIDDIIQAAARKNITLIWLGPPCVRQSWDTRARDLDLMLRARFAGTAVRYVSMRDSELCSSSLQEPDGVHLKAKGYVHMREKAASAAGYTLAAAEPAPPVKFAAARIPLPIPRRPLGTDITGSIAKVR
jgi:hypothetical protein